MNHFKRWKEGEKVKMEYKKKKVGSKIMVHDQV